MRWSNALALRIGMLALAACTRKEPAETVAQPRVEDAAISPGVCHALKSDAGTVGQRFAGFLPPPGRLVGVLYVFQGDVGKVVHYMEELNLVDIRLAECTDKSLIAFIPMVTPRSAARFEKELAELDGGTSSVNERYFFNGEAEPYLP